MARSAKESNASAAYTSKPKKAGRPRKSQHPYSMAMHEQQDNEPSQAHIVEGVRPMIRTGMLPTDGAAQTDTQKMGGFVQTIVTADNVHANVLASESENVGGSILPVASTNMFENSEERVLSHLMFHKAIISERDTGERLNEYLEMVRNLQEGSHIAIKDPFDKSIALMFELIIDHRINPWDVDLVKFSNLYMDRVKGEKDIDFVTAGKIVFMAWSILKLQSDELLAQSEKQEEQSYEPPPEWLVPEGDADQIYTNTVLNAISAPITEMVRRKGNRPVTLIELVSAFEEARKESALQELIAQQRKIARAKLTIDNMAKVRGMMHKESLQEDIALIWGRLSVCEGDIPLSKLHDGTKEDLMTAIISVLFLAFNKKIKIWQKDYPRGEIFVRKNDDNEAS